MSAHVLLNLLNELGKRYKMRSFVKIKHSRIGDITLSFTDIGKSCHVCDFYVANVSFNAIRKFPNVQYM